MLPHFIKVKDMGRHFSEVLGLVVFVGTVGVIGFMYVGNSSSTDTTTTDHDDVTVVDVNTRYATTTVNMRQGPGTGYEIIKQLSPRDNVEVLPDSNNNGWSAIYSRSADSIKGYVSSKYLSSTYPGDSDEGGTEYSANDADEYIPSYRRPEQSEWDGSVRTVTQYLERSLNDPSSYESVEWYKLDQTEFRGRQVWFVRHKYRATNAFGAKILKDQVFIMPEKGEVSAVINTDRFLSQ